MEGINKAFDGVSGKFTYTQGYLIGYLFRLDIMRFNDDEFY